MTLQHGKDVLVKMLKNKRHIIMFCVKDSKLILKGPSINDVTHLERSAKSLFSIFGWQGAGRVQKFPLCTNYLYVLNLNIVPT